MAIKRVATVSVLASLLLLIALAPSGDAPRASAQDGEEEPEVVVYDGADRDTPAIADYLGVSHADAREYLELQVEIGKLQEPLADGLDEQYAGLYIEPQSEFSVVVLLTEGDRQDVMQYVEDPSLKHLIQVEEVDTSLSELRRTAKKVLRRVEAPRYDLGIDVPSNEVYVRVEDESVARTFRRRLAHRMSFKVHQNLRMEVGSIAVPGLDIYGGLPLDITTGTGDCTSGFTVQGSGGTEGVTTAAHCGNTADYAGFDLPFKNGDMNGSQDVQWFSTPDLNDKPWARDGSGTARRIRYWISRSSVPIGALVCKHGMTTGYGCGRIYDRDAAPNYINDPNPVFMVAHNDNGQDIFSPGDSGAAVYAQDVAYGIGSGIRDGIDMIYMSINYISSLNIDLLLAGPE